MLNMSDSYNTYCKDICLIKKGTKVKVDEMSEISRGLLGETVYLHNEQFVVKGQDQRSRFAWHQDSGYSVYRGGAEPHQPYLTCWIALDDMSAQNGTISVLSFDEFGAGKLVEHWWDCLLYTSDAADE